MDNKDKVDMPWDGAFPIMPSRCSAAFNREPAAFFLIHPPVLRLSLLHSALLARLCPSRLCLSLSLSPYLNARDGLFPAALRG